MSGEAFTPYIPKADSLAARVATFFRRFPDEELSIADIALKWQTDPKNIPVQLERCVEAGLLVRSGSVYFAGPDIVRIDLTPMTMAMADTKPKSRGHVRTVIDIEAIEFEDAPIGVSAAEKVHDRWMAKMKTMPAGKSFVAPAQYRHALRSAVTALRKQGWKLSVLNEGEELVRVVCSVVPAGAGEVVV